MSELYAPGSELDQGGSGLLAPDPLSVDASAIDKNLRAISHVEAGWRLPELPDEVRFDLATLPGMDHGTITHFLYGTERDAFNENDEQFNQDALTPTLSVVSSVGQYGPVASSGFEDSMAVINSLRGLPAPQALDADAVQRWKLDAIDKGYMKAPEDGVIDSTWSPELSALQRQMQHDSFKTWQAGDRPGAVGLGKGLEILNQWTSPSGLMRLATDLDLWWDVGQLQKEASSWGDKWRKLGDSDGPLDFAKNLFDALTGPIDDAVVPALNIALLFSGVGVATNFGRMAITGTRATEAATSLSFFSSMYEVPAVTRIGRGFQSIGRGFDATVAGIMPASDFATIDRLGQASMTANRMIGNAGSIGLPFEQAGGLRRAGRAMAAWRANERVIGARGLVQTGMRLGFTSQVENSLLPNYKGGFSASDIPLVADAAQRAQASRWMMPFEILFTPYTMFAPGSFTGGGRAIINTAAKTLGTAPGRAVAGGLAGLGYGVYGEGDLTEGVEYGLFGAALGVAAPTAGRYLAKAEKYAGYRVPILSRMLHLTAGFGRTMAKGSFVPIAEDQLMSRVIFDAHRIMLPDDEFLAFQQGIREQGQLKTVAGRMGTDVEAAAADFTFRIISGSIDHTATLQGGSGPANAYFRWLARNKLTAQLRSFGDNPKTPDVLWTIVQKEGGRRDITSRYRQLKAWVDEDPTRLAEMVAQHNEQAVLTMRQLLSPENLPVHGGFDEFGAAPKIGYGGFDRVSFDNLPKNMADDHYTALVKYVAGSMKHTGPWSTYQPMTHDLFEMSSNGLFDALRLKSATSKINGRDLGIARALPEYQSPIGNDVGREASGHVTDMLLMPDGISMEQARLGGFYGTPLASEINPSRTSITLARAETALKGEYLVAADELTETLNVYDDMRKAMDVVEYDITTATKLAPKGTGTRIFDKMDLTSITTQELNQQLRAVAASEDQSKAFRRVQQFMQHMVAEGVDVSRGFQHGLDEFADSLGDAERWTRFKGQGAPMFDKNNKILTGLDALKARAKKLRQDAVYVAAEVDRDDLLTQLALSHGSDEIEKMRNYFDMAESQGYKVVHGADFLMPDEVMHVTGIFNDINERNMNAMTLGNFFGRRQPRELSMNVQQAQQRSIARQLSKAIGDELAVDDERVIRAIDDIKNRILPEVIADNRAMVKNLHQQNVPESAATAVRTAWQPGNFIELGRGRKTRQMVVDALAKLDWSKTESAAIWQGVKESRYANWQDMGLAGLIEGKLRGRSQLMDALHVLGGTTNGTILRGGKTVQTAIGGALIGAGTEVVNAAIDPNDDIDFGNAALNALIGAGVRVGAGFLTRPLEQAIDLTKWAQYGYLADGLATFRDRMRFSMNPMFDISRVTEAFMLGQIGVPKRTATGERLVMPLNQSPRTLRKRLAKSVPDTYKGDPASYADREMNRIYDEMRNASAGKFDPNELDSTGLMFQQVGVMGHNPTAWMASTMHYLKQTGMNTEDAWKATREAYTYGTRSRSAFEQSINFVFFPFSFIKKTGTHMAQWIADDLSRSVLIHDTVKLYELLNDHIDNTYDGGVSAWIDDHVPFLRRLNQLNTFAYGISPGKFGGVNAPFLQAFVGDPTSPDAEKKGLLLNLMSPQGVNISQTKDQVFNTFRKTIPALNDLEWFRKDMIQQGHVLFDPTHQTEYAQARDAFADWNEYKKGVNAALLNVGATWYDLRNNAGLKPLYDAYRKHQAELNKKYPGWGKQKIAGTENAAQLALEREFHRTQLEFFPEEATLADAQFVQLEQETENVKAIMAQYGFEDWEDMPPEAFDRIRLIGLQMVEANKSFLMLWRKFWSPQFGELTSATGV